MHDFPIGDEDLVRVPAGKYSLVFAFILQGQVSPATYVRLSAECGATI